MYSRFVVSLSLISLAFTLSTIYTYNNFSIVAENFIENQTSVVQKAGVEFYALPPIVFRAVERATYDYEQWLWNNVKESSKVNTNINDTKIIEYGIRWNNIKKNLEFYCKENPTNLDYCKEQTWNYINTTKYFLANFTNVTKSQKYIDYIFQYGNYLLSKLNNTDPDKKYGYVISAVHIIPLKEVKVNEITKDKPTTVKVLIVVEVAVINKDENKVAYKVRLPYEVDLEFWIEGDINNTKDPTWVKERITDVVTKEENVTIEDSKCKKDSTQNVQGCGRDIKTDTCDCDICYTIINDCCESNHNDNDIEYIPISRNCTITYGSWNTYNYTINYGHLYDRTITVAKRGYIGLHYVYRIKTTVKYRKDLIELPFIAEGISDTESWTFTPFARTSGAIVNDWIVEDEFVDANKPCFAFNETGSGTVDYTTDIYTTPEGYTIKGVPVGAGYCNGYVYIWYIPTCNSDASSCYTTSVVYHCNDHPIFWNRCPENKCLKSCNIKHEINDGRSDKDNCNGKTAYVWEKRCLWGITDTINRELIKQNLQIDIDVPVI